LTALVKAALCSVDAHIKPRDKQNVNSVLELCGPTTTDILRKQMKNYVATSEDYKSREGLATYMENVCTL
jgi:hypothetical protein